MYKYVLFDFDGTVFDTGEGITKSAAYALKKQGIEADPAELGFFVGPPLFDSFKNHFGMTDAQAEQAVYDYRERYKPIGLYECSVYDGIAELLKTLGGMGCRLAIATSKPLFMAETLLKRGGLYELFDVCCGAEEAVHTKSKAETVAEAMMKLGAENRSEVIMVGDTKFDIIGAHENGIAAIGVSYGYGSVEELKTANADHIVDAPAEIAEIVK